MVAGGWGWAGGGEVPAVGVASPGSYLWPGGSFAKSGDVFSYPSLSGYAKRRVQKIRETLVQFKV